MIDARTAFPDLMQVDSDGDETYFDHPYYKDIYELFGYAVVTKDEGSWQGDTRVFYHNIDTDGRFGYLKFGWGSCSGCDALQACHNYDDLQELINQLENYIIWFDTKEEAISFLDTHDWENDYCVYEDEYNKEFILDCQLYLTKH